MNHSTSQACRNGCLGIMDPPGACWEASQHPGACRQNFSNRCGHLSTTQPVQCKRLISVIDPQIGDGLAVLHAHGHRVCILSKAAAALPYLTRSVAWQGESGSVKFVQQLTFIYRKAPPVNVQRRTLSALLVKLAGLEPGRISTFQVVIIEYWSTCFSDLSPSLQMHQFGSSSF